MIAIVNLDKVRHIFRAVFQGARAMNRLESLGFIKWRVIAVLLIITLTIQLIPSRFADLIRSKVCSGFVGLAFFGFSVCQMVLSVITIDPDEAAARRGFIIS